jgi:hypothetical protein
MSGPAETVKNRKEQMRAGSIWLGGIDRTLIGTHTLKRGGSPALFDIMEPEGPRVDRAELIFMKSEASNRFHDPGGRDGEPRSAGLGGSRAFASLR